MSHAASGQETGMTIARKYAWGLDMSQSVSGAGGIGGLLASLDTVDTTTASDDRTFAYFYDGNGNVTQLVETTGGPTNPAFGSIAARYEYDAQPVVFKGYKNKVGRVLHNSFECDAMTIA